MQVLDRLARCAGNWRGDNVLQDPHSGQPDHSAASATVAPILAGRFIRVDYAWAYQSKPQEGSLLIGADRKEGVVTAHWVDTWHMSDVVMACTGRESDDGGISVRGSYPVAGHPDGGWRIDIGADSEQRLRMVMFNSWPAGTPEALAMETSCSRA